MEERPEDLRPFVSTVFPVYDARYEAGAALFYVTVDRATLAERFESLRRQLKDRGYYAMIRYEGGEHQIHVVPAPPREHVGEATNAFLIVLTVVTTTLGGAMAYFYYENPDLVSVLGGVDFLTQLSVLWSPTNVLWGFVLFSLPLLFILGVHELGHYVVARRHGVAASLPFFIPLPPFFALGIGTMGAFISIREPIPNRRVLLDIGLAGPLAGFLATIPVLLLGFVLMTMRPLELPPTTGHGSLGTPLAYLLFAFPFPFSENQVIHPTAFAGWVGLFVTGINLLPAGQLDGGHVAHALLGDKAKYASYGAVVLLVILGLGIPAFGLFPGLPGFSGWIFFALLIAILGVRHSDTLDAVTGLDPRRVYLGLVGLALLALCFTPTPLLVSNP
ncbi:MAG TPA: site-2 protease family protein [Candidatus Thermoplasmatota archaeon]|nr:site-2 protease family protein [Candidatus Thermoplasmatota archaeon]